MLNLETGQIGENIAKEYLQKKGYKILRHNYRTRFEEIDLIAQKDKKLVLVEVRTKRGDSFGTPEESLTKKKLRKLWLNARAIRADRVDAVCIVLETDNLVARLEHYENIV